MNVMGTVKKASLGGVIAGMMIVAASLSMTGCLTDSKKDDTTPTDTSHHTALSTEVSLLVGAQGATPGSVVDIDGPSVLSSVEANAAQGSIDLVFLYFGGEFHLDDAVAARADGVANSINLTNSYDITVIKHVDMVKVTTKPADQEAAKAAFTAGSPVHSATVSGGDMFLVMSTGSKLALVTIGSPSTADKTATSTFKLSINTI